MFYILENICSYENHMQNQYHIVLVVYLKRKGGNYNGNLCSKSEMYITVCKIDSITKLYIGKGLVLAIVSGKHVFKIIAMKRKLEALI
jgi:hypothetical protein